MKFFPSSKILTRARRYTWPVVGLATILTFLVGASRQAYSPIQRKLALKADSTSTNQPNSKKTERRFTWAKSSSGKDRLSKSITAPGAISQVQGAQTPVFKHLNIITTIFWVGEAASADNGYIANNASAWDERWKQHYGGFDDPNKRNGFYPADFTPKENPFYIALPYSDITDDGDRKASATKCPLYASMKSKPQSWCKNSWIAVRSAGKIVYAQWQDTGPYEEDDVAYVFGKAAPKNRKGAKAGLDVSPAVRDYLGLEDVDTCDWAFVPAKNVPKGPWKKIVTTSLGGTVN